MNSGSERAAERCKTCKHWNAGEKYGTGASLGLGRCEAAQMFWESTEWKNGGRVWAAEAENKTAFVQDTSDYSASLYTKAEHGCTMHDLRSAAQADQTKGTP